MVWPSSIRFIALPSLVFSTLFLWNGLVYLLVVRTFPAEANERRKFLYFSFTSISLALYSFSTFNLYCSPSYEIAAFWQRLEFVALVFFYIFFVLFSAKLLELKKIYWKTVAPFPALLFLPFIFFNELFLTSTPAPKTFSLLGYHTQILEVTLGPLAYAFLGWCLANLFYLALRWTQYQRRHFEKISLPISFALFALAAVNDSLVAARVYQFYYLLEAGFLGYIFSMGVGLFRSYVEAAQQLARKSKEVEALNEEMQFLLSSISHDLMAPLVSIRGFMELLEESDGSHHEEDKHYLERIKINAVHMAQMLEGIVSFLRIGRVELPREQVDLKKVVGEVMVILGEESKAPGRVIEMPKQWPEIFSSERGIKQILLNLLQNAIKYASGEAGPILLDFSSTPQGFLIAVANPGPSIPPEMKEKIFKPFFQIHQKMPGSGMGLAIVKKTAENLGGRAWLDESYTKGVRFCVSLPGQK